jgi:hypothetical protein
MGCIRDLGQVRPSERFSTRKVNVGNAKCGGFLDDAGPCLRVQLVACAHEIEGVGTIGTLKRAPMREFRQEAKRYRYRGHGFT